MAQSKTRPRGWFTLPPWYHHRQASNSTSDDDMTESSRRRRCGLESRGVRKNDDVVQRSIYLTMNIWCVSLHLSIWLSIPTPLRNGPISIPKGVVIMVDTKEQHGSRRTASDSSTSRLSVVHTPDMRGLRSRRLQLFLHVVPILSCPLLSKGTTWILSPGAGVGFGRLNPIAGSITYSISLFSLSPQIPNNLSLSPALFDLGWQRVKHVVH